MTEALNSKLIAVAIAFTIVGAVAVELYQNRDALLPLASVGATVSGDVKSFDLTIKGASIDMGNNATWHAWTYNGTVPGPTLEAKVGDVIRVTVHNTLNLTHSFHTHLSPYPLESDGSQLNTITGIGGMAMIPPGGTYTYEFLANVPGLFYYHCHSAEGGYTIQQHMAQGLYGAIIIHARDEPPSSDQVVFMAERGFNTTGSGAPFFIMNGHGMPGGERALEHVFHTGGVPAVQAALGTLVPVLHGKVGVMTRIDIVNIGDMAHSFHLHGQTMYSELRNPGMPVPAQVTGLIPGEVDRVEVTPTEAGLWLFHCHVVSHADGGMIGVMVVDPA